VNIFVDTSALYALMLPEDRHHQAAQACFEQLRLTEASLVSTNYILLECASLIQRRQGFEAAQAFLNQVARLLDIVWIERAHHERAVELWSKSGRRELSLVDCVSFWVMRHRGLRHAVAFDAHFEEAGFEVLPRADRVAEQRGAYRAKPAKTRR
jgi:predicted nucleic acid-binding protein